MVFYNGKLCSLVYGYGDLLGSALSIFNVIREFTIQTTLTYRTNILPLYFVHISPFLREDFCVVCQQFAIGRSCPHTLLTVQEFSKYPSRR
jgi:hypothetical protein